MTRGKAILGFVLAGIGGAATADWHNHAAIVEARQNEAQANGLESQCKATLAEESANNPNNPDNEREEIEQDVRMEFHEEPTGDYRVLLYGENRALVCEEQEIKVIQQGDAVSPIIIECRHKPYVREE